MKRTEIPKFGPLNGVKVMHATNSVAGPFAAQIMADFGAEVIWLENNLFYDYLRDKPTDATSAQDRRNQRNISLDIPSPGGREIFLQLVKDRDIFIEASKGGQWAKWGLTDEVLWEHNPKLVIAHISGFGQSGVEAYVKRPSYDEIAQAFGCHMVMNGYPDLPPIPGAPIPADYLTGLFTAFATISAFYNAQKTGIGDSVDSAQFELAIRCHAGYPGNYFQTGELPIRNGSHQRLFSGYGCYKCKDGEYIYAITVGPGVFPKTIGFLGLEKLYEGKRLGAFCGSDAPEAEEYEAAWVKYFSEHTADEAQSALLAIGIPCSVLMDYAKADKDPHYIAREVFTSWDTVEGETFKGVNVFPKLKKNPGRIWRARPTIGMDNEDILKEAGFSDEQIEKFYADNVIGKKTVPGSDT